MPLPNLDTSDIRQLRQQFVAWMEGAEARAAGEPRHICTYRPRTAAGDAWENGWERIDYLTLTRDTIPDGPARLATRYNSTNGDLNNG